MQHIYLVRHGDRFTTPPDPNLTQKGKWQAKQTGLFLQQFPITQVISSPLKRAHETATFISQAVNIPVTLDERLRERINYGDITNQSWEDFTQEWVRSTWDRSYIPPSGHSSQENGERVEELVETIGNGETHMVLVSHSGTITDFLRTIFNDMEQLQTLVVEFPGARDFYVENCSVTHVVHDQGKFELKLLNSVKHLEID